MVVGGGWAGARVLREGGEACGDLVALGCEGALPSPGLCWSASASGEPGATGGSLGLDISSHGHRDIWQAKVGPRDTGLWTTPCWRTDAPLGGMEGGPRLEQVVHLVGWVGGGRWFTMRCTHKRFRAPAIPGTLLGAAVVDQAQACFLEGSVSEGNGRCGLIQHRQLFSS